MSDPVQLEEKKSGKSKKNKESKKSNLKSKNNEEPENNLENEEEEKASEKIENKQNNTPQISTRAYLEQNVVPVVQEALLECAKKRPDKPLEFIGNYILNRAKGK